MTFLYWLGTSAYHLAIRVVAFFGNSQARKWVNGRRDQLPLPKPRGPVVWMHCASLGEWEQGRPVMATFREAHPDWTAVLTFFSPSGYERCKDSEAVDHVRYLPADGPKSAKQWIREVSPEVVLFVKYEFWFYHLRTLHRAGIPCYLIAASFRPEQRFFHGRNQQWWRKMLFFFDGIITQTQQDADLLTGPAKYPKDRVVVGGDPRMDRTLELAETPFNDPLIEAFTAEGLTIVAGSVWPEDIRVLWAAWEDMPRQVRIILAPHQLHEHEVARTQVQWNALRYTTAQPADTVSSRVLILDTIGMLSRVYRYGDLAYVGGAFKTGLHNTLEPLAYNLPTIFGPRHQKFPEAAAAIERGGAFSVDTGNALKVVVSKLLNGEVRKQAAAAQQQLAKAHAGAGKFTAHQVLKWLQASVLTLLFCCLACTSGRAQEIANDLPNSSVRLRRSLNNVFEKGNLMAAISGVEWRPRLCLAAASLRTGKTISLEVALRANLSYTFLASAESESYDIDLYLRDQKGQVLASDDAKDGTPIVEYTVESDGIYQLQLHAVSGPTAHSFLGISLLCGSGGSIYESNFRATSNDFFTHGKETLTRKGASWESGNHQWSIFGFFLDEEEGVTLRGLRPGHGRHTFLAVAEPNIQELNLYLANQQQRIVAQTFSTSAHPVLPYSASAEDRLDLRVQVDKSRKPGFMLLGIIEQ
ncbi:MAG: glycosyltransferase N-terminal domain-containing protein [Bacteroidota bacterium]